MPWRRKPAHFLRYWTGPVDRSAGFKTVLVFCDRRQHHNGLKLADLRDWDWYDNLGAPEVHRLRQAGWVDGGKSSVLRKTFAAFVAVATIAGSLAVTPASAQRGVTPGVAAPGRYWAAPYGAGPGPYTILAVANG